MEGIIISYPFGRISDNHTFNIEIENVVTSVLSHHLGMAIDESTWLNTGCWTHYPFTGNKFDEVNFEIIHKLYFTPTELHKKISNDKLSSM